MLGAFQHTVSYANQRYVLFNAHALAQLRLVETLGFAFLMIYFNGPAMATNTEDFRPPPRQFVGYIKLRFFVRKILFGKGHYQFLPNFVL